MPDAISGCFGVSDPTLRRCPSGQRERPAKPCIAGSNPARRSTTLLSKRVPTCAVGTRSENQWRRGVSGGGAHPRSADADFGDADGVGEAFDHRTGLLDTVVHL